PTVCGKRIVRTTFICRKSYLIAFAKTNWCRIYSHLWCDWRSNRHNDFSRGGWIPGDTPFARGHNTLYFITSAEGILGCIPFRWVSRSVIEGNIVVSIPSVGW